MSAPARAARTASARAARTAPASGRLLALAGLILLACGGRGSADSADAGETGEIARGQKMLAVTPLPPRPEAIALAQSVEALALKEGAGARAVELHALAAQIEERVWRIEHREQDAKEAIDLYRAASKDLALNGACDAGARGAFLAGEAAHNAETTYAELYRVQRRSNGACGKKIDDPMTALAPFKPDAKVLEAIDRGLAGEGAIALAVLDGGASRVLVAPHVQKLEQWGGPEAARIVVHLDRSASFRVGDQPSVSGQGARTYVDLDGVELGSTPKKTAIGGIVNQLVAEPTSTGSRISLDLNGPAYRRVFHLLEPFRIVIDIAKHPPGSDPKAGTRSVTRVAIDAGHGGYDPGAKGPTGVQEKDITLAIAHKVAPILAKQGLQVMLTRDDDHFVDLEERTARANAFGADVFISIHCNAAERVAKRGVETYVLDTTTSNLAGRVAARENATSEAASNEVAQLLASMRIADQATRSTRLAELLQRSAVVSLGTQFSDVTDGGIHRAAFYVLVGARMPAVLFETSYISNATEESRLASADYQQRLADGIANAVKAYREGR